MNIGDIFEASTYINISIVLGSLILYAVDTVGHVCTPDFSRTYMMGLFVIMAFQPITLAVIVVSEIIKPTEVQ